MMDKLGLRFFSIWTIALLSACAGKPVVAEPDFHPHFKIELSSREVVDGGMFLVYITPRSKDQPGLDLTKTKVSFEGTEYAVFATETGYESLLGVPFNTPPCESAVEVTIPDTEKTQPIKIPLTVKDGKYAIENLAVEGKYVEPPKKTMKRILKEQKEVGEIYRRETPKRYWKGAFKLPIESEVTSPYGGKRYYNGQMRNFHSGTDLRAKVPTPIIAPEAGKIVMSKDLYFTGHTILIDHGYGMYTLYAHMSKREVKVGDEVKQGDQLGLSGATGRISGPHLHWAVILKKNKFNPLDLTRILK